MSNGGNDVLKEQIGVEVDTSIPDKPKKTPDINDVRSKVLELLDQATSQMGYSPELIETVPSGFDVLDLYTGGIPIGAPLVLVGNPGSGKSTLATCIAANWEKMFANSFSVYVDNEFSMSRQRLEALGVKSMFVKTGLTLEDIHELLKSTVNAKTQHKIDDPVLFVWDTYANTMSQKEMNVEDPTKATGWRVRLLAHVLVKMIQEAMPNKIALIIINQLRDVLAMDSFVQPSKDLKYMPYGKDMPGGNPLKFNAHTLLHMKDAGLVPENYGFHGSKVEISVVKCKARPSGTKFYLIFDHSRGFSNLWSKLEFLIQRKAIVASGPMRVLKNDPSVKFYLRQFEEKYNNDETFRKAFDDLYESEAKAVLEELHATVIYHEDNKSHDNPDDMTVDSSTTLDFSKLKKD